MDPGASSKYETGALNRPIGNIFFGGWQIANDRFRAMIQHRLRFTGVILETVELSGDS